MANGELDPQLLEQYLNAITAVESGGNYGERGPVTRRGDRAYGRYQVMGANVGPWTERHFGQRLTPEQFLANPAAQDAVFRGEFGSYVRRYGNPQDAASVWFTGVPYAQAVREGRNDAIPGRYRGIGVEEYVRRFNSALGRPSPAPSGGRASVGDGSDEMMGLGMTAPAAPPAAAPTGDPRNQPQGPQTWGQWLGRPDNRAFLMSMGLQLMTPTWGGPMAQAAAAIGAGAQAQAGTQQQEYDRAVQQEQIREGSRQAELNRQNRIQTAEIGAESRLDVAHVRTSAMLERAKMIGLRTPAQQNEYAKQVRSIFNTLMAQNPVAGASRKTADELYEQALQMAARAVGAPGPTGTPTEPPPAPAPGPSSPATPPAPAGPTDSWLWQNHPVNQLLRMWQGQPGAAPAPGGPAPSGGPAPTTEQPTNPQTGQPLKVGDVINGKRYNGGPWRDSRSWELVAPAPSMPSGVP